MSRRAVIAVLLVALVVGLVLASSAGAASLASLVRGGLDVDVVGADGTALGTVRGSIDGKGKGTGAFRPAAGATRAAVVVSLRATRTGTTARITLRGRGLTGTLAVDAAGDASGSGRLSGKRVALDGIASDQPTATRRGQRILVVGTPSGEAWEALRTFFRPVQYDPARHTRDAMLANRAAFHRFAGIVFGEDVEADDIREHALLHTFSNAGKWVVIAPATTATLDALHGVHPYDPNTDADAVAIRSTGPEGDHDRVKPTVVYPAAARKAKAHPAAVVTLTGAQERRAAQRRQQWFLGQLTRLGKTSMTSARKPASTGRRTQSSTSTFNLPYNAAAIELAVPFYHEFTISGAQNVNANAICMLSQSGSGSALDPYTYGAACPGTLLYQIAGAGNFTDPPDATKACTTFLANGYTTTFQDAVKSIDGATTGGDGVIAFDQNAFSFLPEIRPGDACPQDGSQIGALQGNDYYYAIFDPNLRQHTIVALTDPTVSAAEDGTLFRNNAANGTVRSTVVTTNAFGPIVENGPGATLKETAWFLGAYVHALSLSGTQLTSLNFEYSGSESYPNNAISVADASSGTSVTRGISVGVFGSQGTVTYSDSVTEDASVSIQVPNWDVNPTPAGRAITYTWGTSTDANNTSVPWASIWQDSLACCSPTADGTTSVYVPNDLNVDDFSPASLTIWTGEPTYGTVSIASTRTVYLVDSFTRYTNDSGAPYQSLYSVTPLTFADGPDEVTPYTKNPAGPGIDLCDPAVMAPEFAGQCGAPVSLTPAS